jgi:hypothetical protein
MKTKLTLVLAVAGLASLMGASLADAHYLSGGDAFNAARVSTKRTAQRLANDNGTTVDWAVKRPCSQRSAHRFVCDAAFRWTDANGNEVFCTAKVISQFASRTSYQINTKATGINCN